MTAAVGRGVRTMGATVVATCWATLSVLLFGEVPD